MPSPPMWDTLGINPIPITSQLYPGFLYCTSQGPSPQYPHFMFDGWTHSGFPVIGLANQDPGHCWSSYDIYIPIPHSPQTPQLCGKHKNHQKSTIIHHPKHFNHHFSGICPSHGSWWAKRAMGQVSRPRRDGSAWGSKSADASPCRPPDVPCLGAQDHQFLGMVRLKKCGFRMNWKQRHLGDMIWIRFKRRLQMKTWLEGEITWVRRDFWRDLEKQTWRI